MRDGTHGSAPAGNLTAGLAPTGPDRRDQEVMQALVTAGAVVALADGRLEEVERAELVSFVDRQGFVPTIPSSEIAAAFDKCVRQMEDRYHPNAIVDALRPLAGLSLASVIVRTVERVAAADGKLHHQELQMVKLMRLLMMSLPASRPSTAYSQATGASLRPYDA